jgi:hypothetical protein
VHTSRRTAAQSDTRSLAGDVELEVSTIANIKIEDVISPSQKGMSIKEWWSGN